MESPTDRVIRAVTKDGSFRVIVARTTDMVREGARLHGVAAGEARLLGELLTGAVLLRETMAPEQRVQMVLSGHEGGAVVADSYPGMEGLTRGLVSHPEGVDEVLQGPESLLKVIRSLPRGQLHQSVVEAGEDGVAATLMSYLETSEQVTASLGVATVMDGDRVVASAGYVVQLMPECAQGPLMVMTERLNDFAVLDGMLAATDASAEALLFELLYGFEHERLAETNLVWGCPCNAERALGAVRTLGPEDIAKAAHEGEVISLTCEYCPNVWEFGPEVLRGLLEPH